LQQFVCTYETGFPECPHPLHFCQWGANLKRLLWAHFGRLAEHALRDSKAKEHLVFHGQLEKAAKIEMAGRQAPAQNFAFPKIFRTLSAG
jgi:hypothetical protein